MSSKQHIFFFPKIKNLLYIWQKIIFWQGDPLLINASRESCDMDLTVILTSKMKFFPFVQGTLNFH